MAFEIEVKAWVDDPGQLRNKLDETCRFSGEVTKEDTYYRFPGKKGTFRVRKQDSNCIITLKKKSRVQGIERNLETEFTVSDCGAFIKLVEQFDCSVFITKKKQTRIYKHGDLTVELSRVASLGWFVEIEKIVESDSPAVHAEAEHEVSELLKEIGIGAEKIEPRYYTELLAGTSEDMPTSREDEWENCR